MSKLNQLYKNILNENDKKYKDISKSEKVSVTKKCHTSLRQTYAEK